MRALLRIAFLAAMLAGAFVSFGSAGILEGDRNDFHASALAASEAKLFVPPHHIVIGSGSYA